MSVEILRGISRSGKSTYAKRRCEATARCKIVSADDFFVGPDGVYRFQAKLLPFAHAQCLKKFVNIMLERSGPIVVLVDNTNTTAVEIAPYMALAQAYGHETKIITILTDIEICLSRPNPHGTTREILEKQYERMEEQFPPWWKHETIYTGKSGDMGEISG